MLCRLISFDEFSSFESLLASPDSLYQCMFQLFDANSNGVVSFGMQTVLY